MSSEQRKHHVTIEDCDDEEDRRQQQQRQALNSGRDELDLDHINSSCQLIQDDIDQHQDWEEVDALEEKARSEKLQDQSTAMANASETARIVKEAQQSSGC